MNFSDSTFQAGSPGAIDLTTVEVAERRAVEGEHFVQDMRNAIREELAVYAVTKRRGTSSG